MKKSKKSTIAFSVSVLLLCSAVIGYCQGTNTTKMEDVENSSVKLVGHQPNNTIVSLVANAKVGGTAGAIISRKMDNQAAELRSRIKDIKVERVEEGIIITIDSRSLFEHDSFGLASRSILKAIAQLLDKYRFTSAVIEGHTDNTGEEIYNQSLSEQRAHEIETYLVGKGIEDVRIKTRGYGEGQPIASNDTDAGRQLNRRIEIGIFASDEVRAEALAGNGEYTALKQ